MSQQSLLAPSPLSQFEMERLQRIEDNRRRMEEMGVLECQRDLLKSFKADTPVRPAIQRKPKAPRERHQSRRHQPMRQSKRLAGVEADNVHIKDDYDRATYSEYDGGLEDILADDSNIESLPTEKQEQFQEIRCSSAAGRGSVYDSVAGITCHFCRQKKLCGEEGCPRCSRRSTTADCIGKSDCSRCHGATGRFCRACLLIRYGQSLEDVRKEMDAGTYLCPHCYEDEHPEEGWMCNSSICMKRRGYKPTGIAIYDAQQRGFPSVAHWLQAQMRKRTTAAPVAASATSDGSAAGGAAAVSSKAAVKEPSKDLSPAAATESSDSVEAPNTPMKDSSDAVSSAVAEARVAGGRRVTRGSAAAGAVAVEVQIAKRACVAEAPGARRSLRMGKH